MALLRLWAAIALTLLLTLSARADDLAAAQKAVRLQQFEKAADLYRAAADTGSGEAQYQLGNLYLLGRGVAKNEAKAREWFEKAVGQQHPGAQFALAQVLREAAPERSAQLLQAAAEQGYTPARTQLERGAPTATVSQEAPLDAQWFGAARGNQTAVLQQLLQQHGNINLTDTAGRTALFYAVEADSAAAVDWLIARGADVKHRDQLGLTAAQRALERRRPALLQKLMSAGADKTQILTNGDNLLHYAIRLQQYDVVAPLAKAGVNVNHRNKEGWTALDLAEYQEAGKTAALLRNLGGKNGDGWRAERGAQDVKAVAAQLDGDASSASRAVTNDNEPLLEQLLRKDPQLINTKLEDGSTLLILAIKHHKPQMVATLIKHKADVNQKAYRGVTALQVAVQQGQQEIIKLLLEAGANAGIADESGRDALITALEEDKYPLADLLLQDLMGDSTSTASVKAHLTVAKAPVDRYILLATQHHAQQVLEKLLPYASSAAAVDEQKRNALWFAAAEGNAKLIPLLLRAGVSASQTDTLGRTPFLMAVDKGCLECARQLLPHSNVNHQSASGNSPLMLAATNKDAALTAWLLQNKAEVEARNQRGDTALMLAVSANAPEVVGHLLNANASVTRKNRLGFSAIDLAQQVSPQMLDLVKSRAVLGVF